MKVHCLTFLALSAVFMLVACSSDTDSSSSSSATVDLTNETGFTITHFSYSETTSVGGSCQGTNLLSEDLANGDTTTVTTAICNGPIGYRCVEYGGDYYPDNTGTAIPCGTMYSLTYQ